MRYWCTTGHEIQQARLPEQTELVSLDEGAVVRICVQHGAPIEIVVAAPARASQEARTYLGETS